MFYSKKFVLLKKSFGGFRFLSRSKGDKVRGEKTDFVVADKLLLNNVIELKSSPCLCRLKFTQPNTPNKLRTDSEIEQILQLIWIEIQN